MPSSPVLSECPPGAGSVSIPPPLCSSYCGTQAGSPGCSRWTLLPVSAPPAGCCILPSAYSPLCITLLSMSQEEGAGGGRRHRAPTSPDALDPASAFLSPVSVFLCLSSCGARRCHCFLWYRAPGSESALRPVIKGAHPGGEHAPNRGGSETWTRSGGDAGGRGGTERHMFNPSDGRRCQ